MNAIQQALAGFQSGSLAIGAAPAVAGAAPVIGNDATANQLRILQMAGLVAPPVPGASPPPSTPAPGGAPPPPPPGHQESPPDQLPEPKK